MTLIRSALTANVVCGLPNVRDYIHKNRDRLMEERRQSWFANGSRDEHNYGFEEESSGVEDP